MGVGTVVLYRKDFRFSDLGDKRIQSGTTQILEKEREPREQRARKQIFKLYLLMCLADVATTNLQNITQSSLAKNKYMNSSAMQGTDFSV